MTTEQKAKLLLMLSYEHINGVNCYGITPQKNNSQPYQKAKKRVLYNTLKHNEIELYNFIKENL
jgi:hypothetical protein